MLAVFPAFYNPLESHLGMATKLPALHLVFSGKTIAAAYHDVVKERGEEAKWYTIPPTLDWEKSPSLNGITISKFRNIISDGNWNMLEWRTSSLIAHGRRAKQPIFRALSKLMAIPAKLPLLEEVFLGRICCVLEKKSTERLSN